MKWKYKGLTIEGFRLGCNGKPCVHIHFEDMDTDWSATDVTEFFKRLTKAHAYATGKGKKKSS